MKHLIQHSQEESENKETALWVQRVSAYSQPMILMNPYQNLCSQGCSLYVLIKKSILGTISVRRRVCLNFYSNQGLIPLSMDSETVLRYIILQEKG